MSVEPQPLGAPSGGEPPRAVSSEPIAPLSSGSPSLLQTVETWAAVGLFFLMTAVPAVESLGRALGRGASLVPGGEALWRHAPHFLRVGIPGAVLYTQHFTLWVGFLGALAATGFGKHLALATGERIPAGWPRQAARVFVGGLSSGVCVLLAYAANILISKTMKEGVLPGGIPEWWSQLVMPGALGLMALRFAWRSSDRWLGRLIAGLIAAGISSLDFLSGHAQALQWPGAIALLAGILLGSPVFVAMAGLGMLLFFGDGTSIAAVPVEMYKLVESPSLPAIPLLTAAGYVLAEGGASRRLLRLANAAIGWIPGALGLIVVLLCTAFTTVTGGSGVTILALGGLVMPMLRAGKYSEGFSLGLVTCAGSLGLLFVPSIPVILYAVVAKASPKDLYAAGFWPGILLVALVSAWAMIVGVRQKTPRQRFRLGELAHAAWQAKWELSVPVVLYVLYRLGLTTLVEMASLALLASVAVQSGIFSDLPWRQALPRTLSRAAQLVGAVILLLSVAMGLTNYLVDAEVPKLLIGWTKAHIHSQVVFLLVLNAGLLVLGSVLEIYSAIIILAPLLVPMAIDYGVDPLHMGIVFLANLELGFLFPPMGLNLILSSSRFGQPLTRLYRVALPFLLIMAAGVLLVTYVPRMTTGAVAVGAASAASQSKAVP